MNIQRLSALLNTELPGVEPKSAVLPAQGPSFQDVLSQALTRVQQDQVAAGDAAAKLATGEIKDVAEVMISSERANLSLGLALQVRNKLLEAYQEIMRTPL